MNSVGEEATNGLSVQEDDDFFGDQSSDALETESRKREVEVLRRQHMTSGIREGASAAHDKHLQEGFDEGFAEGAKASAEAGFLYVSVRLNYSLQGLRTHYDTALKFVVMLRAGWFLTCCFAFGWLSFIHRMGACALLEAFFSKGTGNMRATSRSQALGDTEVPSQDMREVEQAGAQLQADLRDLPESGSVSVERAKEACRQVAVFEVPASVVALPEPSTERGSSE